MSKKEPIIIEELFNACDDKEWAVYQVDFDCKQPYIKLCQKDEPFGDKIILVPESIAFYLRTNWCGSLQMRKMIETRVKDEICYKIKNTLGME